VTTPLFRGPADRRWWHIDLGDDSASWTMDVRVDEITGVRFVREPYPFRPHFPGREVLTVQCLGPGEKTPLPCYIHDLYDGQRMRPEKLEAWRALRERYGNRDESRVDRAASWIPHPESAKPSQSRRPAVANTVAKPLDDACQAWTRLERRPRARTRLDEPARLARNYEASEGWGFESLRAPRSLRRETP
jgi:hypothetical protein